MPMVGASLAEMPASCARARARAADAGSAVSRGRCRGSAGRAPLARQWGREATHYHPFDGRSPPRGERHARSGSGQACLQLSQREAAAAAQLRVVALRLRAHHGPQGAGGRPREGRLRLGLASCAAQGSRPPRQQQAGRGVGQPPKAGGGRCTMLRCTAGRAPARRRVLRAGWLNQVRTRSCTHAAEPPQARTRSRSGPQTLGPPPLRRGRGSADAGRRRTAHFLRKCWFGTTLLCRTCAGASGRAGRMRALRHQLTAAEAQQSSGTGAGGAQREQALPSRRFDAPFLLGTRRKRVGESSGGSRPRTHRT